VIASRSELNRLVLAICDLAIEWRDSTDQTKAQCGEELLDLIDGNHPDATADASKSSRNPTGNPVDDSPLGALNRRWLAYERRRGRTALLGIE